MNVRRAWPALVGGCLLPAAEARAAPSPEVPITVVGCPDVDPDEIARGVDAELAGRPPPDGVAASVRCSSAWVTLEVRRADGASAPAQDDRAWASRRLSLDDLVAQGAAERTIALVLVELLREPAPTPAPRALERGAARGGPESSEHASPPPRLSAARAQRTRARLAIDVLVGLRRHAAAGPTLLATSVALAARPGRVARYELDASFAYGVASANGGEARAMLGAIAALAGLALPLPLHTAEVAASAGVAAGVVDLAGVPRQSAVRGDRVLGPWVGPTVALDLVVPRDTLLHGRLRLESGIAFVGTTGGADGETVVAASGPWFGLSLGAGLAP